MAIQNNIKTKKNVFSSKITFFIFFLYIQLSLEKIFILKIFESEIIITIKGKETQQILNNETIIFYDSISMRNENFSFNYLPSEILVNGNPVNIDFYVYNLNEEDNNISIKFNETIENCNVMFYGLTNITKIDFTILTVHKSKE